jgi:hypothetical protein
MREPEGFVSTSAFMVPYPAKKQYRIRRTLAQEGIGSGRFAGRCPWSIGLGRTSDPGMAQELGYFPIGDKPIRTWLFLALFHIKVYEGMRLNLGIAFIAAQSVQFTQCKKRPAYAHGKSVNSSRRDYSQK